MSDIKEIKRPITLPMAGPPQIPPPPKACYEAMGEEGIFAMIEDFYERLGQSEVRDLFPDDLQAAAHKSAMFFVGLFGGPPLYHQHYGPPRLRQRHFPFKIDRRARDVWLACFEETLAEAEEKYGFPAEHLPHFRRFLDAFSLWMINQPG